MRDINYADLLILIHFLSVFGAFSPELWRKSIFYYNLGL
ncbi:hypothetical protein SPHINGO8BC_60374 [Sphingobacterium multivorum]|uniref:Uncharacterized protein n=1 Tax=Sphingobacterium multivorum TaxID=28454 RepID=A0A654DGB8_SPHMU|nr:hypothetical protein SPHINGO8BC_60374 [Sphingobacterium multivorum]